MKEENYEYLYHLINDCEFEDGMSNSAIEFLKGLYEDNQEDAADLIYDEYQPHHDDSIFLGKLYRCLCYIDIQKSFEAIDEEVYDIIAMYMKFDNDYVQESAIMLCEELRNSRCLELLTSELLKSYGKLIKDYANLVIAELTKNFIKNKSMNY